MGAPGPRTLNDPAVAGLNCHPSNNAAVTG
jgi:hypothetical protein